jgi:hypothetical protein
MTGHQMRAVWRQLSNQLQSLLQCLSGSTKKSFLYTKKTRLMSCHFSLYEQPNYNHELNLQAYKSDLSNQEDPMLQSQESRQLLDKTTRPHMKKWHFQARDNLWQALDRNFIMMKEFMEKIGIMLNSLTLAINMM